MSSTLMLVSFFASILTTAGKAEFVEVIKAFMAYIQTGDKVAFKKVKNYKYLGVFQGLIGSGIKFVEMMAKMTEVAKITSVVPRKTLKVTYKGKEHLIGVVKATDVGLPSRIVGEAVCRPMSCFSFVVMSDHLYENEFILMHEVGHAVQRMALVRRYGEDGGKIMDALNAIGMLSGGFPLEPQADAFATKKSKCNPINYAKEMTKLFGLITEDLPFAQKALMTGFMTGRYLGGLVAPVVDAKVEEVDSIKMVLPEREFLEAKKAMEGGEDLKKVVSRLVELDKFLCFGDLDKLFID